MDEIAVADKEMAALRASKKALRKEVTQCLRSISEASIEGQSKAAVTGLLSMKEYQQANRVSVYLSIEGKEIQTQSIIEDALAQHKRVFVPYVHGMQTSEESKTSVMDMLALKSIDDLRNLARDKWGIPSIPKDSVEERENCFGGLGVNSTAATAGADSLGLDLVVVPGVAFDRSRGRLGHGKGYYDRFLDRCKEMVDQGCLEKLPLLVALALDEQVLEEGREVPRGRNDWLVDGLIVGSGVVI